MPERYVIQQMDELDPVECPCGHARRAFASKGNSTATLHLTEIHADSRVHYHKKMTEIYLILEGEGEMELDGEVIAVIPMTAVLIKPGCHHRAIGRLRVAISVIPPFDPEDEWFDDA